jgi:hypothetical protein
VEPHKQTLDIVFTRARPKNSRTLAFIDFLRALQLTAAHMMHTRLPQLVSAVLLLDPGERETPVARVASARRLPVPTAPVPVVHVKVSTPHPLAVPQGSGSSRGAHLWLGRSRRGPSHQL